MSIGKPDYDAIEIFREKQDFFNKAVGINAFPSRPTLRQRINLIGNQADTLIKNAAADLIRTCAPVVSPIQTSAGDFLPLDMDVSPFDNSKTQKEGVSRTYKGVDGFAPIFAYLGTEGYLVNLEFREGKQHCQKNTPQFINDTLDDVRQITDQPILMRLDSGNDSQNNFPDDSRNNIQFIIKLNFRRESPQKRVDLAKKTGEQQYCRSGKRVWIGKTLVDINDNPLPSMQDLMYMAGQLVTRCRKWYLSFGQLNPFSKMMERIYHRLNLLPATKQQRFQRTNDLQTLAW